MSTSLEEKLARPLETGGRARTTLRKLRGQFGSITSGGVDPRPGDTVTRCGMGWTWWRVLTVGSEVELEQIERPR